MPAAPMNDEEARTRLLDAAEALFYADGIQAVGMDRVRTESGVPLKRLYRLYPAKEALVTAYLERRDRRWMADLRGAVTGAADPVGAVFDWLARWFSEPGFRGCAFLNAYGELGAGPAGVLDVVRRHKAELRALLAEVAGPGREGLAEQLLLLVEGATVVAALEPGPGAALRAREAAHVLVRAAPALPAAPAPLAAPTLPAAPALLAAPALPAAPTPTPAASADAAQP